MRIPAYTCAGCIIAVVLHVQLSHFMGSKFVCRGMNSMKMHSYGINSSICKADQVGRPGHHRDALLDMFGLLADKLKKRLIGNQIHSGPQYSICKPSIAAWQVEDGMLDHPRLQLSVCISMNKSWCNCTLPNSCTLSASSHSWKVKGRRVNRFKGCCRKGSSWSITENLPDALPRYPGRPHQRSHFDLAQQLVRHAPQLCLGH